MHSRRIILAGSLTLLVALSARSFADEVVLIPNSTVKGATGGRVRGTVTTETPTEVVVKLGTTNTTVPTSEIVSIRYDGQPADMTLAESRESGGLLAEAADLFKKAAAAAEGKPFIVQAALFHQARDIAELALADPARVNEAIGLLDKFISAHGSGRHIVAALELLARLQLQKGDVAGVDKTVGLLSKQPQGADRAAVLRARVFAKRGDHTRAIEELDRLIKTSPEGSIRQREARLAKAESLAALKKFTEAEDDVRAVIKATPAEDYVAQSAAYNTLGDCLRAAGKPKEALFAFLHTDLLFAKDKEQHPRALASISQLFREIKRDDRADEYWQRLKQEYPQSPLLSTVKP
jgi:tetratricopeptide (TPR) repeat protein